MTLELEDVATIAQETSRLIQVHGPHTANAEPHYFELPKLLQLCREWFEMKRELAELKKSP